MLIYPNPVARTVLQLRSGTTSVYGALADEMVNVWQRRSQANVVLGPVGHEEQGKNEIICLLLLSRRSAHIWWSCSLIKPESFDGLLPTTTGMCLDFAFIGRP
jgi:hypothetical protein